MFTKVLAFLALAIIANANDITVGLNTDGKKFFDENRQANPALWRQMDNVTIKAPENEVIRRVVITDLRPDKDGDVKIVEGGEGQKNVTIELKSPTVLRGYEFHIEVYSTPEQNVPFTNDESNTEIVHASTDGASTNPTSNSDSTSKLPDVSTDKMVPAIFSQDEVADNERQGRNAKNEDSVTSEGTTESSSTAPQSGLSTTTTQNTESVTENNSDKSSDTSNKFDNYSTIPPIPLNKNFNMQPIVPGIVGKDVKNDKFLNGNDETRHVRDTDEMAQKPAEVKLGANPKDIGFESTTENEKAESTTEIRDSIPVEEKSEGKDKEDFTPKPGSFDNRKYTSFISSKAEYPAKPVDGKNDKLRNVRGADDVQKNIENISTTAIPDESTTTELSDETTTTSNDDVTTEPTFVQNPVIIGKDNQQETNPIPTYLNDRQWDQRFNNPTFQSSQSVPGLKLYPAVLPNDQSTHGSDHTNQ